MSFCDAIVAMVVAAQDALQKSPGEQRIYLLHELTQNIPNLWD